MRLIRNRPESIVGPLPSRSVVTIGNFDGVHLGHQALVQQVRACRKPEEKVAVVTFEPLPQAFFRPDQAPPRLSSVRQKLHRLAALDVDICWLMRFDRALAQLSPAEFVQRVLVNGLSARHVVVGEDFRFGHKREGDVAQLTRFGQEAGFSVATLAPVMLDGERISSTAIRGALEKSDFDHASRMLGRPFRMEGRVVPGQKLGRTLGYPTANLRVPARPSPVHGIFAVRASGCDLASGKAALPGVASLGHRPTVGGKELLLEVHLFDFAANLYGQRLQVEFVAKLRDESHFPTVESMQEQMRRDEQEARRVLDGPARAKTETTELH